MKRYALLEITGDGNGLRIDPEVGSAIRLVCQGSAAMCLLAAAEELPSRDIHGIRLFQLPAVQRRVGGAERNSGLGHTAVSPAETN